MPRFSKKRARVEEDASDGGDAGQASAPAKKVKSKESKQKEAKPKEAKSKEPTALGSGVDNEGNPYWEISAKRRVGIAKFNKMVLVNIREYYDQAGELKPGKKGISLTLDQYQALLKNAPVINAELRKMGEDVQDVEASTADPPAESPRPPSRDKRAKANIEATSDEESS
ncbi:hypothetical protein GGTG_00445 [Gaeumannomyces tritici R3-111a-1]|uniref:Transcriptional coactivator p15 (PC4) C-terminal domain-containing protein n=1 Tax=Gaeumannomyces tritici (strain R3-111a-1) TaxID=644352 RepID=J3NGQ6_GAET3|nr:hypothetical protein GGTG_00445 [Gaeumannomyces tritici R3-111a-1]EJT80446.1 hypothetical protein GGTG_00445 [Gaeumannomyces tritici R3-111a-1]